MIEVLSLALAGAVSGGLYAIMASGLVLTYQSSGIFNLGHGAIAFVSALSFYILHSPIIVLVAWAVQGIAGEPWLKFGLVSAIGVPLSFLVAYGVRKVPYASRIL